MTNVFFTSDLHFGHKMVAGLRGFGEDVEAHDAMLMECWAAEVTKRDQVWVLGDLSLKASATGIGNVLAKIDKLPGEKHFIAGNHDPIHPLHRDSHKWMSMYMSVFASVQTMATRRINGEVVLLSHFPYERDHGYEVRFAQYRLKNDGNWLIHGHTHGPEKRTGKEIHVGVDAWDLRPVSLDEVTKLMEVAP